MYYRIAKRLFLHAFVFSLLILATYQIVKDAATRNMLFIAIFSIAIVANIVLYELKQIRHFLGWKEFKYMALPKKDYDFLMNLSDRISKVNLLTQKHFLDYEMDKTEKKNLVTVLKNLRQHETK